MNEYHWGDFKGDPDQLMEHYYDAHLYVANWGAHRVVLRLPSDLLDLDDVEDFCIADQVSAWATDESVVLDIVSEDEPGDFDVNGPGGLLSGIVGVRTELAEGDLRPLYLAWLAVYGAWERDEDAFDSDADDDVEPPVPPGLGALTAAQGPWPTSSGWTTTCSRAQPALLRRPGTSATVPMTWLSTWPIWQRRTRTAS